MSRLVTELDFCCSAIAAINETIRLRVIIDTAVAAFSDVLIYHQIPGAGYYSIADRFVLKESIGIAEIYEGDVTFSMSGLHAFIINNPVTGLVHIAESYCAEWASRIDVPVSQLGRQRADIQRIYGRVSNK